MRQSLVQLVLVAKSLFALVSQGTGFCKSPIGLEFSWKDILVNYGGGLLKS